QGRGYHDSYVGFDPASQQDRFYGAGGGGFHIYDVTDVKAPKLVKSIQGVAGMTGGPAAPPELARQALLASRTNAWLSIPMLFFMGAASHYALFSWPVAAVTLPPVP
ncbi:MAG: hypothetical protein AAB368_07590, partial [bacterium]